MNGARSGSSVKESYYTQRTLIGLAGFSLPTAVWLGSWALDGEALLGSISTYYYSSMRDVFVAILMVTGVFLVSYQGYQGPKERLWGRLSDNLLTNLAGLAAFGIALFPTAACQTARCSRRFPPPPWTTESAVHAVHIGSAATFYIAMGVMALFAFTKSDRSKPGGELRHWTYVVTGAVILLSAGAMAAFGLLPDAWKIRLEPYRPIFVGEAVGIWAFGIAWLAKGHALQTGRDLLETLTPLSKAADEKRSSEGGSET